MLIFIFCLVLSFIALFFVGRHILFVQDLLREFRKKNVIVFGKKGTGKDLVFQFVIRKRKKPYYSNIDYGGQWEQTKVKDISVFPNTYDSLINDEVIPVHLSFKEKQDIYLSDGGIYLPSWNDSKLYKAYPSFPIYYAVIRHLTDSNIHINTQNLDRVWKAIREQADFYVRTLKTFHIGPFFFTKVITYDRYQTAQECALPLRSRSFNEMSKAQLDLYNATKGEIRQGWIINVSPRYDTRYFRKLFIKDEGASSLSVKSLPSQLSAGDSREPKDDDKVV